MLIEMFREGGPFMPVLLVIALAGYVMAWERVILWGIWITRDRRYNPDFGSQELRNRVQAIGVQTTAVQRRLSPLERVLVGAGQWAGLPRAQREERLQLETLIQLQRVDARISTLGWLGGILPMLGLLGTVSGMITTFEDLALTTSRQVLSRGLSEALWTTEVGLLGALPLLAVHHVLSRLRERWLTRVERCLALLARDEGSQAGGGGAASPETRDSHET